MNKVRRKRLIKNLFKLSSQIINFPKFSFVSTAPAAVSQYAMEEAQKFNYGKLEEIDPEVYEHLRRYWLYTHFHAFKKSRRPNLSGEDMKRLWGHAGLPTVSDLEKKEVFDAVMDDIYSGGPASSGYWYRKSKDGTGGPKWTPTGDAWSAAFVTYVMSKVDGAATWPKAEAHSAYKAVARRTRTNVEKNPNKFIGQEMYLLFTSGELEKYGGKIEVGDVVGRDQHMDIVVSDSPYMTVGGNTTADAYAEEKCKESKGKDSARTGCTTGPKMMNKTPPYIIKRVKIVGGPGATQDVPSTSVKSREEERAEAEYQLDEMASL